MKTFNGQTADELLETAKIIERKSGDYEITVTDKDGWRYRVLRSERRGFDGSRILDGLSLIDSRGFVAQLSTSKAAYAKLIDLEEQVSEMYTTQNLNIGE